MYLCLCLLLVCLCPLVVFLQLCRSIWLESPDFFILGECWNQLQYLRQTQDGFLCTQSVPPNMVGALASPTGMAAGRAGGGGGGGDFLPEGYPPLFSDNKQFLIPENRSLLLSSLSPSTYSVVPSLLAMSGILPQMFLLPNLLPSLLGMWLCLCRCVFVSREEKERTATRQKQGKAWTREEE